MEVDPGNIDTEDPSASATLRYQAKKSEREDVQKRTFTKWMNMRLVRSGRSPITDLFEDMKDGTVLMSLIEVLTGQNLNPEKGKTRVHHLNNVNHSIKFLEKQYNIKLVNICSDDVVNGNTKLILGLIWNLVLHWQMKDIMKVPGGDRPQSNLEKTLLAWCRECTQGYARVNITNFTTSFRDGLAFNALFHYFRPNDFYFDDLLKRDNLSNLKHAFIFAEKTFNIEQILDPEDVNVEQPDKKSILIYVMCCYQTLNRLSPPGRHLSTEPSTFVVTSPSSPPPFYDQISSPDDTPWMPREKETMAIPTNTSPPSATTEMSSGDRNEVEKFQAALEGTLVWLLQAKSNLGELPDALEDVKSVKRQFQDHEEFMVQLTEKQSEVGELFEWGGEMLRRSNLGEWTEKEIEAQMKLLNQQWEELRLDAMEKQTSLQRALMTLQQKQLDDLASWLGRMEDMMENSKAALKAGSLQDRVEAHKALQEEVESQQHHVSSLQNMVVVVDDASNDNAYEALEKQLENLGQRWAVVCRWVEESCANLKEGVTLWAEYETRKEEFSAWLNSCESRLSDPDIRLKAETVSVFKDIMRQVRELKSLEMEMDKWMLKFDDLSSIGASLERYISEHEESINMINHDMQSLKDRWDVIVKIMEAKSKEIEDSGVELKDSGDGMVMATRRRSDGSIETESIDAWNEDEPVRSKKMKIDEDKSVEKLESLIRTADENVTWLKNKLSNMPAEPVKSSVELNRRRDCYKNLLEQSNQRESVLTALEKDLDVNVHAMDGSIEDKKKEVDEEWRSLKSKVKDNFEHLSSTVQAVSHYNALMKDEIRWQEQMSKILNRKPRPSGDAEELAEELDLLENLTSSRNSMNLEHLKELSSHMSSLSPNLTISSLVTSGNMEDFTAKNVSLVAQAKERMKTLEEGINAAQSREGRIIDMTQWMAEVSSTLQHHLEADLLAGDVPDEHNGLVQEFAEHEEFLQGLEIDVEVFRREGKHEAADRLVQQIELLKRQFEEVKMKLLRFQKPPDFDAKMSLVRRVLEEINDSIQLLEIGGSQIDEIQTQLEQYQKFYKKMSELKPDVEYVVRTGRQVVDRKQVEFPNRLNSQIDAIKFQYNKLGSQVTTGKVSLEKCLRLSRKITKELDNVRNLVTKIEEKCLPESRGPSGLDRKTEELVSIDSFLTEANGKLGIIPTLKDAVAQWTRISVEGSMREPSVNVSEVEEKLVGAIQLLNDKRNKLSIPRGGAERVSPTNQRLTDFLISPTLLTSVDKFLEKIKSADVVDVDELKKLVREEDNFENEINLELKRLAKVKDDRKSQGDLEVAEQITNVVNNLQSRWMVCKTELKTKLQEQQQQQQHHQQQVDDTAAGLADSFHSDIEDITCWLDEAEVKVGSDCGRMKEMDDMQLQMLKEQTQQRKIELEAIIRNIRSSKNAQHLAAISPLLSEISRRLQKLQSSFSLTHPSQTVPLMNPFESVEDSRTPTAELRVQTPLERQIFFDSNGKPVSTARNEVRKSHRSDDVDGKDDACEMNVESAPLYSKVLRSANQKEEKNIKGGPDDSIGQRSSGHHKEWNIVMPDELVAHHHQHHQQQPQKVKHTQPSGQTVVGPQNKEKFITGLNNFMSVIMEKAKPHSILIGSMNEIDEAVQKEKTKLQELQAMMPSIKTLINKLELMQHDPDWSQNTKALTKKLCENWDKAMQDIRDRQMELMEMKEDGMKFETEISDMERKMAAIRNISNNNNSNIHFDANELNDRVEAIDRLCVQLANKYPSDDPKKIHSLADKLKNKWLQLSGCKMDLEEERESKFGADTKDLQMWLTRVELVVGNLSEKESKTSGISERNQLKTAAEDLRQEIIGRKAFIKSLSTAANQIVNQTGDLSLIRGQISDASNRWKRVKDELDELISKLSEHQMHHHHHQQQQQQYKDGINYDDSSSRDSTLKKNNKKLHEQLLATRSIEDALTNQPPIADELQNVRMQKAAFQSLLDRINEQRPYVLSTLQQEKNSTDEKAKELSKELEKKWIRIQKMSADRSIELDAAIEKMTILQDSLDDLNQHLSLVEAESSSWLSLQELVKTGDVQREIMAVQAFQQKIASIQGEVERCNDAANQLEDVVPSHRVVVLLEDITRRWRNLQSATEERVFNLQKASKRHGSFSQHILTASVSYPWERATTNSNVPYYINHSHQSTHWDHPEMTKLVESLSEFDEVRFSAYRTGMKLRHIQKSLHLDCITFDNLSICLNSIPAIKLGKHFPSSSSSPSSPMKQERMDESISKLSTNNTLLSGSSFDGTPTSSLDRTKSFRRGEQLVGVIEIAACLRMCFESLHFSTPASAKENKDSGKSKEHNIFDLSNLNVPLSMDLVLNWLLNVYDSSRTGMIRLTSLKTALVLMCKGSLDDKYKFLFKISSNDEGFVDKTRMTRLLKDCIFLPKQLGEVASFGGTNVEPSVTSCFDKSGNKTSISEKDFLNWMKLEPQSLVWIPVMQRLKGAEEAHHHVKCHCCKQLPLRGLRYRCLKCFSYDLCQKCFFAGKTSKSHKLSHPMQEYSSETTSSEDMRDFTKVFKNKFRSKRYFQKHRRIGYLPVNASAECGLDEDDDDDDDVEETSPQNTVDDSTLLQRGIRNLTLKSQSEVFGPNLDGFADEHNLIAQYCKSLKGSSDDVEPSSPLQILKKLDAERKEEVEEMIRDLENENKNLKAEYERLLRIKGLPGRSRNGWSNHGNRPPHGSADDDVRRIEEKLQVQDENNHHLKAELSQLQGGSLREIRSTSMSSSSSFPKPDVSKVYADNGVRELELDRMLQKLQTDDLPVNPGEANVSSLFREVEQINRAVETLVDIMTEGEDLRDRTNKLSIEKGGAKFNKSE